MPDALKEAAAAEVHRLRWTTRLRAWLRRVKRRVEWWAGTLALVSGIFAAATKAWLLLKARDVGRAEQASGGSERMAVDRVDEPKK